MSSLLSALSVVRRRGGSCTSPVSVRGGPGPRRCLCYGVVALLGRSRRPTADLALRVIHVAAGQHPWTRRQTGQPRAVTHERSGGYRAERGRVGVDTDRAGWTSASFIAFGTRRVFAVTAPKLSQRWDNETRLTHVRDAASRSFGRSTANGMRSHRYGRRRVAFPAGRNSSHTDCAGRGGCSGWSVSRCQRSFTGWTVLKVESQA